MIRRLAIMLTVAATSHASNWYAATNGLNSNLGTLASPWHLQHALTNASVVAGDTVWLRGGYYTNTLWDASMGTNWNNPTGSWFLTHIATPSSPITWRAYANEKPKIDRPWHFGGNDDANWNVFRDLEFIDTYKGSYTTNFEGVQPPHFSSLSSSNQWVNCFVHDVNGLWNGVSGGQSIRGCVVYYVGTIGLEHTLYPYCADVNGNIFGWGSGYHLHHGSDGMIVRSNIMWGAGVTGGSHGESEIWMQGGVTNAIITNNVIWDGAYAAVAVKLALPVTTGTVLVANNFLMGRSPLAMITQCVLTSTNNVMAVTDTGAAYQVFDGEVSVGTWTLDHNHYTAKSPLNVLFNDNGTSRTFASWTGAHPAFDVNSTSTNSALPPDQVWVIPNQDQPLRANIAIYNGTLKDNVTVDVSSVLASGDTYQLYDAGNFGGAPIKTGTLIGTTITVPMTNLVAAPILYGINGPAGSGTPQTQPTATSPELFAGVLIGDNPKNDPFIRVVP